MKLRLVFCLGLALAGCLFNDPTLELDPKTVSLSASANPHLEVLRFNSKWYRTFDSTSDIDPDAGNLLFAWTYGDAARHPDSFYVGIDTLWTIPQDVNGDTANDWDLQVCPDGFCMNGLKDKVFGANAPIQFGDTGQYGDTSFQTEHHFQFWPAAAPITYKPLAPANSLFGGMMFVRSRSSGKADTAFAFAAWELGWDSLYLPPLHPVAGYLPKRSDFTIVNGKVRYTH